MYLGLGQPFFRRSEFVSSRFGCRAVVGRQGAVWAAIGSGLVVRRFWLLREDL